MKKALYLVVGVLVALVRVAFGVLTRDFDWPERAPAGW